MENTTGRCLNCGRAIGSEPSTESERTVGTYAIVSSWRVCACGAFFRTDHIARSKRAAFTEYRLSA
jgi:hypothetical protein